MFQNAVIVDHSFILTLPSLSNEEDDEEEEEEESDEREKEIQSKISIWRKSE